MVHPRLKLVSKSRSQSQSRATSISRSASSSPTLDDKDDTSFTSASKRLDEEVRLTSHEEIRLPSFATLDKSLDNPSPPPHPLVQLNLLEEGSVEWDESSRLRLRYDPERDNAGAGYVIPPLRTSTVVPALDPRVDVGGQEEMSNGGEDSGVAIMSEARDQGDINGPGSEAPAVERGVKSSREPEDGPQDFTTPTTSLSSTVDSPLQLGLRFIAGCIDLYLSEPPPSLSKSLRQSTAGNSHKPEPASKPIAVPVLPSSALGSKTTTEKVRVRADNPKNGTEKENGAGKEKEKGKGEGKGKEKGKKKEKENKGNGEKENDPDHVKVPKPLNSFMLFRKDLGAKIAKSPLSKGSNLNQRYILPEIGACWNQLPGHERAHWEQKAQEVAAAHAIKYPGYKYKPEPEKRQGRKRKRSKGLLDPEKERAASRLVGLVMQGIEGEEGLERIDAEAAVAGDDGDTPNLKDLFAE